MTARIQFRRDTALNWTSRNPTLSIAEVGYETDTGSVKIGNGGDAWDDLPYVLSSQWHSFSLSVTQWNGASDVSATFSSTDLYSKYSLAGSTVSVSALATITSAGGTAGQPIYTYLPVAAALPDKGMVGQWAYYDSSAVQWHSGWMQLADTSAPRQRVSLDIMSGSGFLGAGASLSYASGDIIKFTATYEAG